MFYHASPVENLAVLTPHISNHNKALIYLSERRENTLVYLSNAIEKFCRENNVTYDKYMTWASYGFNENGTLVLDEYYPNATFETYNGVSGFIYSAYDNGNILPQDDIPYAYITTKNVDVCACEIIEDSYLELLKAEKNGQIIINRYYSHSNEKLEWIQKTIITEYKNNLQKEDYTAFLLDKFNFLR